MLFEAQSPVPLNYSLNTPLRILHGAEVHLRQTGLQYLQISMLLHLLHFATVV